MVVPIATRTCVTRRAARDQSKSDGLIADSCRACDGANSLLLAESEVITAFICLRVARVRLIPLDTSFLNKAKYSTQFPEYNKHAAAHENQNLGQTHAKIHSFMRDLTRCSNLNTRSIDLRLCIIEDDRLPRASCDLAYIMENQPVERDVTAHIPPGVCTRSCLL